jgi:DNA-directed RNA polymerase specialized sigma24 family protein
MHLLSGDISESVNDYTPTHDELTLALCISKLTDKQKKLVNARYLQGLSVAKLSDTLKRPVSSISQALYVIRNSLKKCVGSPPAKNF